MSIGKKYAQYPNNNQNYKQPFNLRKSPKLPLTGLPLIQYF